MNLNDHQIHRDIYNLCQKIEELPPSKLATDIVIAASALSNPADAMVKALEQIKRTCLTSNDPTKAFAHIVRLCIDAGITKHLDQL